MAPPSGGSPINEHETVLERKMAGISLRLAEMEKAHFAAQRDFERAQREEKGERAERGDRGVEEGEIATPSTPGASRPMFAPRSTDVRAQLYTMEDQKKRAEDEFEKLAEAQAFLKLDPRNEYFSEEEVKTAKTKAGGGAESKEGEGKVWQGEPAENSGGPPANNSGRAMAQEDGTAWQASNRVLRKGGTAPPGLCHTP